VEANVPAIHRDGHDLLRGQQWLLTGITAFTHGTTDELRDTIVGKTATEKLSSNHLAQSR